MALFKRDYNKPGPGVPKNAPKKKGFGRFFEILGRDMGNLVKLNLWYLLCIAPSVILFAVALFGFLGGFMPWFLLFGGLALLASILVGPAMTALYALITRMLRDEPGFIGHDFRRYFKENFKGCALPGMIYSLLVGSQVVAFLYYFLLHGGANIVMVVLYLFSVLVFNLAAPYFFMQCAYLDLDKGGMLKNSLLFALGYLPRTFAGMLIALVIAVAQAVLCFIIPIAILIPIIIGIVLPQLIKMMWYWPQMDKTFEIDKTLRKRTSDAIDESMEESGASQVEAEQ